jgi:hypothetical protein
LKEKNGDRKLGQQTQIVTNMVDIIPSKSIITLSINDLNASIKRRRWNCIQYNWDPIFSIFLKAASHPHPSTLV